MDFFALTGRDGNVSAVRAPSDRCQGHVVAQLELKLRELAAIRPRSKQSAQHSGTGLFPSEECQKQYEDERGQANR
jgi:hypothetical protein